MAKRRQKPLALTRIEGNLVYTATEVTAWYLLPAQRWSYRPGSELKALYHAINGRQALVSKRDLHFRITSQPYPASEWARKIDVETPRPVDPSAWRRYLLATQERLDTAVTADKRVYLGVVLNQRGLKSGSAPGEREAAAAAKEEKVVADIISGRGWEGQRTTTAELEWLMHRSIGLCLPPPERLSSVPDVPWESTDLYQLVDNVDLDPHPFGATTTVSRTVGAKQLKEEVAVLSLGRHGPQWGVDSDVLPWLALPDLVAFPVEISVRVSMMTGEQIRKKVSYKLKGIRDQQKAYRSIGQDEPNALEHQAELALSIEDETARGLPTVANRAWGHVRFAVPGKDVEQALEHVQILRDLYAERQFDLVHVAGTWSGAQQIDLLREFIPGEPKAAAGVGVAKSSAYLRRMPIRYLAAGIPQVASKLGDGRGPYLGYTVGGTRRAVHFDPHHSSEEEGASGLVPVIAKPGAGKTVLVGSVVYANVLRGTSCISFDPSGPFARLTELPELRHVSREVNLRDGEPGTLNPFSVLAEPNAADYPDPEKLAKAREAIRRRRKLLTLDILMMLLPPKVAADESTEYLLTDALSHFEGVTSTDLHAVVNKIDRRQVGGDRLWTLLHKMADQDMANLFFNTGGTTTSDLDRYKFLVVTMPGMTMPDMKLPKEEWTVEQRLTGPLLHLAAWYTSRQIYSRPMHERKMATFDEGHFLGSWSQGRTLFDRLGRDNRKWNLSVLYASQNPADILGMETSNLLGSAFVGKIEDPQTQSEALRLLRILPGQGYEDEVGALVGSGKAPFREFLMRDASGNVDKMRVDLDHIPHVRAVLDTSAKQVHSHELIEERAA